MAELEKIFMLIFLLKFFVTSTFVEAFAILLISTCAAPFTAGSLEML
jgi:hypothetical protein